MSAAPSETAYRQPSQTPNAKACRKRRERLRDAGLCYFCGIRPATSLCRPRRIGQPARARYRARRESVRGTPDEPCEYTRREGLA